jgi:HEAT repeat protein
MTNAVVSLIADLRHPASTKRIIAACALRNLGHQARVALPELRRLLDDKADPHIPVYAAGAISRIAPEDSSAIPVLFRGMRSCVGSVRQIACDFLGDVPGMTALDFVTVLIDDPDILVRFAAARAIGKLSGRWSFAVRVAISQLKAPERLVRAAGHANLLDLGSHSKAAVPQLKKCLSYVPWQVRLDIEEVLWKMTKD